MRRIASYQVKNGAKNIYPALFEGRPVFTDGGYCIGSTRCLIGKMLYDMVKRRDSAVIDVYTETGRESAVFDVSGTVIELGRQIDRVVQALLEETGKREFRQMILDVYSPLPVYFMFGRIQQADTDTVYLTDRDGGMVERYFAESGEVSEVSRCENTAYAVFEFLFDLFYFPVPERKDIVLYLNDRKTTLSLYPQSSVEEALDAINPVLLSRRLKVA